MGENLKTTKLKDGSAIPIVSNNSEWIGLTTPGYCWYNNDATNYGINYGALYNWLTVATGKFCPIGWHVPTDKEWTTLSISLGGYTVAGGKLKEMGTDHWNSPNEGATNETGFTGLPGGSRDINGFHAIGQNGYFYISDKFDNRYPLFRILYDVSPALGIMGCGGREGYSVRCIKDY